MSASDEPLSPRTVRFPRSCVLWVFPRARHGVLGNRDGGAVGALGSPGTGSPSWVSLGLCTVDSTHVSQLGPSPSPRWDRVAPHLLGGTGGLGGWRG